MPLFRSKAEDKVRAAGFDPARLPPGQYFTEKWPVLHAGQVPHVDIATWTLELSGEVEQPVTLSFDELRALPATEVTTDIHCVTRWSKLDMTWEGVSLAHLFALVQPLPDAKFVVAHAEAGFTANLPIEALMDDDTLLADKADGHELTDDHGYPLRLLVPKRYFWKSAKWLRGLEFVAQDQPGFWEQNGYNNSADPWKEERYW